MILDESVRIERGVYGNEGETAAQRVIQHGKAAVCGVHHAYDIHVFRDAEQFVGIQKPHLLPALVAFYKHEQLAEYFAQVAAVDFIYYKEIRAARIGLGFFAEIVKYALSQLKAAFGRAVALYKVLIGVALVELYKLSTAGTLLIQYGLDKLFGYIRFANARRALQYYVPLNVKQIQYIRILLPGYVCFT